MRSQVHLEHTISILHIKTLPTNCCGVHDKHGIFEVKLSDSQDIDFVPRLVSCLRQASARRQGRSNASPEEVGAGGSVRKVLRNPSDPDS